jgi:sulfatase maturation enzyme AslB (radical SAM superfamily)
MKARVDQVGECRTCAWKRLCECGSPGHTYAEYGDLVHKDLFCEARIYWFERYVAHQVEKVWGA